MLHISIALHLRVLGGRRIKWMKAMLLCSVDGIKHSLEV